MIRSLSVLMFLFVFTSTFSQSLSKPISTWNAKDLQNAALVDVRTAEEFSQGHIQGATNIDWYSEGFADNFTDIPKDKTIYLYCKKGGRSSEAQELLSSLGYSQVINLTGGYDAWTSKDN